MVYIGLSRYWRDIWLVCHVNGTFIDSLPKLRTFSCWQQHFKVNATKKTVKVQAEKSVVFQSILFKNVSAFISNFQSLLQTASSIVSSDSEQHTQLPSQLQAKRILYVKSIVRLLRLCGSKYQQLLTTPDGLKSFHTAIFNLLALINGVVTKGKSFY